MQGDESDMQDGGRAERGKIGDGKRIEAVGPFSWDPISVHTTDPSLPSPSPLSRLDSLALECGGRPASMRRRGGHRFSREEYSEAQLCRLCDER